MGERKTGEGEREGTIKGEREGRRKEGRISLKRRKKEERRKKKEERMERRKEERSIESGSVRRTLSFNIVFMPTYAVQRLVFS